MADDHPPFKLCDQLQLLEFPDKFVFKSADPDLPGPAFSVARSDAAINTDIDESGNGDASKVSTIFGVVGTISLLAGTYVLVITSRKEVGSYLGSPVFKVTSMAVLPCNDALKHSTAQEKRDEAYFMTLLKTVETTPGLYYSCEVDLSLSLQTTSKLSDERRTKPLWKQADPRFIWNRNLLDDLIEFKLDKFVIPLIQGSILKKSEVTVPQRKL